MGHWIETATSASIAGLPWGRGQVLALDDRSGLAAALPMQNQWGGTQ